MDGKFFSDETKSKAIKVIDEAINGGFLLEIIDGVMARGIVNVMDAYGDKIIPDKYDSQIDLVCSQALAGEYEIASQSAAVLTDMIVDIPVMDDNTERIVFISAFRFLTSLIIDTIEKRKKS